MTVATHQIPGGARVLLFTCTCGREAHFGRDADLLAAIRTGDVSKAGTWTCGPNGCLHPSNPIEQARAA